MNYATYSVSNRIGYITLNRPDKRNALSYELVSELKDYFTRAQADDNVKVVVLKANGEAFCAGADLGYLQQLQKFTHEENLKDSNHLKELFLKIYTLNKVVIAQVQGHALAGGCGLATVCDFVIAAPEAKFGYTEVKIGFIPAIVMIFLLRRIGEAKAKQLLLSGDLVPAQDAMLLGLINRVVAKQDLEAEVNRLAAQLVESNSTSSMAMTKQMIAQVQSMNLDEALTFASEMNAKARSTADCQKGISAFLNKEKITW
jgi:methylglutaconyl-CoA hydratase